MPRRVYVMAPGIEGMNRDVAAYLVGRNQSRFAQDAVVENGLLRQIKGWVFDGTTADVAKDLIGVWRNRFVLADATRTITSVDVTSPDRDHLYIHNPSSSGTEIPLLFGVGDVLPRCVYNDELILCSQDGIHPLLRYSGAATQVDRITAGFHFDLTEGEATLSDAEGWTGPPEPGSYLGADLIADDTISYAFRVLNSISSTLATLEAVLASANSGSVGGRNTLTAFPYPAVAVYDAGTLTVSSGTATGYGTKWVDDYSREPSDALLVIAGTQAIHGLGINNSANTTYSVRLRDVADKSAYQITRGCPFKDAASYRGSLWGTGVVEHPNRVYIGAPGWNLSLPPGYVPPFDPLTPLASSNPNDFLMFFVEVPTPYDGDTNVALLPTSEGMRVLKHKSIHTIFPGVHPNYSQAPYVDGIGCMDIRSAKNISIGPVWADRDGVFLDGGGGPPIDLTEGREGSGGIHRDWVARTQEFSPENGDTCAIGEIDGKMLVSLFTGGGEDHVTYLYDASVPGWVSEVTNLKSRFFFESTIPDEEDKLFWVGDDHQGRVMEAAPALKGHGVAKNPSGGGPRLQYRSGEALGESAGIEGEAGVGDLVVHANVYDEGAAGATHVTPKLTHGGGVAQPAASEIKTFSAIPSDSEDRVDRHEFRANRSGRLLQVELDADLVGTNDENTKIEVGELALELFDSARGT